MKLLKNTFTLLLLSIMLISCEDFGDLNTSPNDPSKADTEGLLTGAIISGFDEINSDIIPLYYSQHLASNQYTDNSRYNNVHFNGYNNIFKGCLANLQEIINLLNDPTTANDFVSKGDINNQLSVARILKAYFIQNLTDRYGMIPYTQALDPNLASQKYDSQEFIYLNLINELKDAENKININSAPPTGDILLNGNMSKWKKFARSLRLIMSLRLSDRNTELTGTTAKDLFIDAYDEPNLISSNSDNVFFETLANEDYQNYWFGEYASRIDDVPSDALISRLTTTNDPRVIIYATLNANNGYLGMPYGLKQADALDYNNNNSVSSLGEIFRKQDSPYIITTYSQILFSISEAIHRGWISGDAKSYYENGIKASIEQWNVYDSASFNTLINHPNVIWDNTKAIELIGTQKWIALFMQGFESWFEWRRLDFPSLTPPAEPLNGNNIPVRQGYPLTERDLNSTNYNQAISIQGSDDLSTKVWWDVN